VSQKNRAHIILPHNSRQVWTNVNNSFTVTFSDEVHIKMVQDLTTHLKCVAALPWEN